MPALQVYFYISEICVVFKKVIRPSKGTLSVEHLDRYDTESNHDGQVCSELFKEMTAPKYFQWIVTFRSLEEKERFAT